MSRRQLRDIIATIGLSTVAVLAAAQTGGEPVRMTAWAVNMTGSTRASTALIDIKIDRWSTDAERQRLIETFLNKGQDALLGELQDAPVKGRMKIPGYQGSDPHQYRLGWDLRYAMEFPGEDGGRRIVIATDRYIGFWEARNRPRSIDYPFTFIEIHLDANGEGQGKMAVSTKLTFNKKKNLVEIENYGIEPVRLQKVHVEKSN